MTRFLSDRDLRDGASALWDALAAGDSVALVSAGTPRAIVLPLDDSDAEHVTDLVVRVRTQIALERLRAAAARNGADRMTMDEIDAEIAAARAERAARGDRAA